MTDRSPKHCSTEQVFPLSYGQRALWFLQQLAPNNVAYNVMLAARIHAGLDISALQATFQALVERHAALRTTFPLRQGQPIQLVHDHQAVDFTVIDAAGWSDATLHAQLVRTAHQPFDLALGPVLRVHLFTQGSQAAVLLLTMHHIVVDFRSFVILIEEIREFYPAIRAGKPVELPPPERQYTDYVQWQLQMLAGETGQSLWRYWQEHLVGELLILRLPTDRPRPPVQTYQGAVQVFQIPAAVAEGLRALAATADTTLQVVMLAALYVLLYQESNQTDLWVGSPVAGRNLPGFERVVGYFHNPVVLRTNLAGNPSFKMLLRQVQARVAGAMEHQDYPFPLLVERLQPQRNLSYSPIFQVMFVLYQPQDPDILPFLLNTTKNRINLGGLELESLDLEQQVAMLDLTLTMVETHGQLAGSWQYNTDLFDAATITRLTERFQELLTVLVAHPEHRVTIQPSPTLAGFTAQQEAPVCLQTLFAALANRHPMHLALIGPDYQLSYAELELASNQLSHYLQSLGVKRGDKIGLRVADWREVAVGLLGILKAGGVNVPLPSTLCDSELAARLAAVPISLLLTQSKLDMPLPVPTVTQVVYWDCNREVIAQCATTAVPYSITADDVAWMIVPTVDTQVGVPISHQLAINCLAVAQAVRSSSPNQRYHLSENVTLDTAFIELLGPLTCGQSVEVPAYPHQSLAAAPTTPKAKTGTRAMDFSLFFFSSDGGAGIRDKYRLLIETAQFADQHGFSAVWTPERHFHPFGGPFPNPSITSAALAALTQNIQLRAGSVVLPLHHPLRVAEEWAVVDNLSQGRVGLSVASGWHIHDFVFAPDHYQHRRDILKEAIQTLRQIWRGETLSFPGPNGEVVKVQSFPRPIQPDLPIWLTTAFGNPETFEFAGRAGLNILTHLLGQNLDNLAEQIALYRRTWQEHGHSGTGTVTVMLHTFVGSDFDRVRETVRQPFCDYLKSSVSLIKNLAYSADFSLEERHFTEDNVEALLDYAFNRYFETSSLFGTPSICQRMIDSLKDAGVDEVACLVDFGVDSEAVMNNLEYLDLVRQRSNPPYHAPTSPAHISFNISNQPGLPSYLEELEEVRDWWQFFLPQGVDLSQVQTSKVDYFQVHILDAYLRPVPPEVPGELYIGGNLLPWGYANRVDLTAERFIPHPWSKQPGDRLYKTGELWRSLADGTLEPLGHVSTTVTIQNRSVELATLAAILAQHPAIDQAVFLQRATHSSKLRLVGCVLVSSGTTVSLPSLHDWLLEQLPTLSMPANTINWVSLPPAAAPMLSTLLPSRPYLASRTALEQVIANLWQEVLLVEQVGVNDSFFALNGTAELAKQIWHRLQTQMSVEMAPIDVLQHTTVQAWADYCRQSQTQSTALQQRQVRAQTRKQSLQRQREHRYPRQVP